MPIDRLPESVHTLYAELLEQALHAEAEAVAERLPLDTAANELHSYAQRHPRAFRTLTKRLLGQELDGSAESCRRLADDVPMVALRPRG